MDKSILNNVKKALGFAPDYTAFDLDIILHINSTLAVVTQLGLGPVEGFAIEDNEATWDSLGLTLEQTGLVKSYVYLKVKFLFDPPTLTHLITATQAIIEEYETRLHYSREALQPTPTPPVEVTEEVIYVPMGPYIEGGY